MSTALRFLFLLWISKHSMNFSELSFPEFSACLLISTFSFFTWAYFLCSRLTHFYYFLVKKSCHVSSWLCEVGFSLCGFLISLTFTYAIIVRINEDLHVWFCQNLMWTFILFFLQVVNWFVWHFSICFQRTFSRRTRFPKCAFCSKYFN